MSELTEEILKIVPKANCITDGKTVQRVMVFEILSQSQLYSLLELAEQNNAEIKIGPGHESALVLDFIF